MMAFLSTQIHRFTILIGSNIFPLLVPTIVPMSSYGTSPISLLSVGLSLRFFSLKISLISTYKMPPRFPSYLISAEILGSKYLIIWKFSILAIWPTRFLKKLPLHMRMTSLGVKPCPQRPKMAHFIWRIGNFSNILTLISQHSYQISNQMRWHQSSH